MRWSEFHIFENRFEASLVFHTKFYSETRFQIYYYAKLIGDKIFSRTRRFILLLRRHFWKSLWSEFGVPTKFDSETRFEIYYLTKLNGDKILSGTRRFEGMMHAPKISLKYFRLFYCPMLNKIKFLAPKAVPHTWQTQIPIARLVCARSAQLHLVWPALRKREYCSARARTKKCDFGGFCMLDFIFYIFENFTRQWIGFCPCVKR